jgi:hypothetical protein
MNIEMPMALSQSQRKQRGLATVCAQGEQGADSDAANVSFPRSKVPNEDAQEGDNLPKKRKSTELDLYSEEYRAAGYLIFEG